MPLTLLHYPVAYAIYRINRKLSLPGLIVGSMFPDLEILAAWLFGTRNFDRMMLHSLLGAAAFGTMLSAISTVLMYPPMVNYLFKIDREKVKGKCALCFSLISSCLLGSLSHVLWDIVNHPYNPIFWPFQ